MSPNYDRLVFIRHAEHPTVSNGCGDYVHGLTMAGFNEGREIGESIATRIEGEARGLTYPARRAMATMALALSPSICRGEVDARIESYEQSGTIQTRSELDYTRPPEDFLEELNKNFFSGHALRFLFESGNDSQLSRRTDISTAAHMALTLGDVVCEPTNAGETRIVCAREFFYPSFRANLILQKKGIKEAYRYIDWYERNVELHSDARRDVNIVDVRECREGRRINVKDNYSENEYIIDEDNN